MIIIYTQTEERDDGGCDLNSICSHIDSIHSTKTIPTCVICLEYFGDELLTVAQIASCKHYFHINCIKLWLERENTCPICRKEASKVSVIKLNSHNEAPGSSTQDIMMLY